MSSSQFARDETMTRDLRTRADGSPGLIDRKGIPEMLW
jgi:hypothetical protein